MGNKTTLKIQLAEKREWFWGYDQSPRHEEEPEPGQRWEGKGWEDQDTTVIREGISQPSAFVYVDMCVRKWEAEEMG